MLSVAFSLYLALRFVIKFGANGDVASWPNVGVEGSESVSGSDKDVSDKRQWDHSLKLIHLEWLLVSSNMGDVVW